MMPEEPIGDLKAQAHLVLERLGSLFGQATPRK